MILTKRTCSENVLKEAQKSIKDIYKDIRRIIDDNQIGEKIRDGFRVSIVGETNVGKSSLLNLLSKRDVAIVSDEAGTTRDVIETYLNLEDFQLYLQIQQGSEKQKMTLKKGNIISVKQI